MVESQKVSVPVDEAIRIAGAFMDELADVCERMMIVGSARRRKPKVGDVEIAVIPRPALLAESIHDVLARYERIRGGRKKPAVRYQGLPIDLHIVDDPEAWGVTVAIYTGPRHFSKALVTPVSHGGLLPDGHRVEVGTGRVLREDDSVYPTPTEEQFLRFCRAFVEPERRETFQIHHRR